MARGLPYSWNFEFLFATFENFRIRKYSKCRFLGKIGQGSALHWCFWFLKFSKCGFLRKFDQGSAQFLNFWGFVCDFWKNFEISEISKCQILGKIGQGSALYWCFWFLKFSKCWILRKFDQGSALYLNSQCLNCLITFWDVFGTLFFLLS